MILLASIVFLVDVPPLAVAVDASYLGAEHVWILIEHLNAGKASI